MEPRTIGRRTRLLGRRTLALATAVTLAFGGSMIASPPASAVPADPLLGTCLQLDDDHLGLKLADSDITEALTALLTPIFNGLSVVDQGLLGSVDKIIAGLTGATITLKDPEGNIVDTLVDVDLNNGVLNLADIAQINLPQGVTNLQYTIVPSGLTGTLSSILGPLLGVGSGNVSGTADCASALPLEGLNGSYHPVTPARVLDTRATDGPTEGLVVKSRQTVTVTVAGRSGVPTGGVSAVNLNVTATAGSTAGFVQVFPAGSARPSSSNLNYAPGQNIANTVFAELGTGGRVSFYNGSNGTVHLLADVSGYFITSNLPLLPGGYKPLASTRIFDSRPGQPFAPAESRAVQIDGVAGVPADATSVVLNLTATNTNITGYLAAYPNGIPKPYVSNLNFTRGKTVADQVVVPIGSDGKIRVYHAAVRPNPANTADVIVDVVGYFNGGLLPASTSGLQKGTVPARILDTRNGNGLNTTVKIPGKATVTLQVSGRGNIPSSFVRAALLTVTTTQEGGGGFITAYPTGVTRPTVSTLSFDRRDVANQALVAVGTDGTIKLYNGSPLPTHLVVDVTGYIVGSTIEVG